MVPADVNMYPVVKQQQSGASRRGVTRVAGWMVFTEIIQTSKVRFCVKGSL